MKRLHEIIVCTLLVLFITDIQCALGEGAGMPVMLSYDADNQSVESSTGSDIVRYTFVPGLTKIEREGVEYFVDYERLQVYTYHPAVDSCDTYSLYDPEKPETAEPDAGERIVQEKGRKLGSMKIAAVAGGAQEYGGYPCKALQIDWGWEAQLMRTAITPRLSLYGLTFTPQRIEYLVTTSIDRIDDLFSLAAEYEPLFRENPLLRQLDILGVLRGLRGVPVYISRQGKIENLRSVIRKRTALQGMDIPLSCRLIP